MRHQHQLFTFIVGIVITFFGYCCSFAIGAFFLPHRRPSPVAGSTTKTATRHEAATASISPYCRERRGAILYAGSQQQRSLLFASTTKEPDTTTTSSNSKIPMTLLSGFLGSGKTSTLTHLLENTDGIKIGVIVNDVASVNIDAKLVAKTENGIMELQNGCACCSLADELVSTVDAMVSSRGDLDAVVIELSGVADPIAIKSNWQMAKLQNQPATLKTDIANVVTLVDACTFGTDYMSFDDAGERDRWVEVGDCNSGRRVAELLAEQVEAANVILVNKIDLAEEGQVEVAASVARGLNKDAKLEEVEFGKASPRQILGKLIASADEVVEEKVEEVGHSHSCTSHSHESHADDETEETTASTSSCTEPGCTDASHSHSHEHHPTAETTASSCNDPDCTDPTHSHSHDNNDHDTSHHSHSHSHETSTDNLGIVNFVYKRDRPFDGVRLMTLLNQWPVPIKDDLDISLLQEASEDGFSIRGEQMTSPFVGVLRSKGFCWMAPQQWLNPISSSNPYRQQPPIMSSDAWRHETAMYWSHAGKHFGITTAGKWWGTIEKDQIGQYVPDQVELERILTEDFVTEEFGDRRQELVFIGTRLKEDEITKALDACLYTDEEMEDYRLQMREWELEMSGRGVGGGGVASGLLSELGMDDYNPEWEQ